MAVSEEWRYSAIFPYPSHQEWDEEILPLLVQHLGPRREGRWTTGGDTGGVQRIVIRTRCEEDHVLVNMIWPSGPMIG